MKVLPGVRVNFTHRGMGVRVGPRGLGLSMHSSGRGTLGAGLPGTGMYWREDFRWDQPSTSPTNAGASAPRPADPPRPNTAGGTPAGGEHFDVQTLVEWVVATVYDEHGVDLSNDTPALQRITSAAKVAIIQLVITEQATISLPSLASSDAGPLHFEQTLTSAGLAELVQRRSERHADGLKQPATNSGNDAATSGMSALLEGIDALDREQWEHAEALLRRAASLRWVVQQSEVTIAIGPGIEVVTSASSDAAGHALVEVMQRQGRLAEALELLETMEPTELVAVSAAELLIEADRPDEALSAFGGLRGVDSPAQQCLNVLVAVAAERTGDISGADSRLRAVLAADDLEDEVAVEALAVRAALAQRVGRDEVAQACRRKLARLDPEHPALEAEPDVAMALSAESLGALRRRVEELTDAVVERETELADRRARLEAFARRFTSRVGRLMAEVDELVARLAKVRADAAPQDPAAREAAEQARARAEESAHACSDDEAPSSEMDVQPPAPATMELARMWREAARMMHPDATMDENEKQVRHRFFVRLEQAYRDRDLDEVSRIMQEWTDRPEAVEGDSTTATAERLRRTAAQLERQARELEAQLGELTADPMWTLMLQVDEAEEQGRDLLVEMSDRLRAQRDDLADDLLTLEAL